jgi:hypothetical protein
VAGCNPAAWVDEKPLSNRYFGAVAVGARPSMLATHDAAAMLLL